MSMQNKWNASVSRRGFLQGAAALGTTAALCSGIAPAQAQMPVVRAYGTTTAQLKDWDLMRKAIGVDIDYTGTNQDVGRFLGDVMGNDLGETIDLFFFDGGTEDVLGAQGFYAEVDEDHPEFPNWARTPDSWRKSDLARWEGKQYGVPVMGNADSFGYFPDKIGANPNGQDEISWSVMFEDDRTRGRVSYDRSWLQSLPEAGNYLNATGRVKVEDPADMPGDVAKQVVDYLIERKRAGQFRTLHNSLEEQIQLFVNREVDVCNCWEPAVKESNLKLGPNSVIYAYTVEGYYKWFVQATISKKAEERGNLDAIYKVLNYMIGGEYRAYQAVERGYAGPNMDLGVKYAEEKGWKPEDIENIRETQVKVDRKFEKPFFTKSTPDHASEMEEEWQRFLNA